MSSKLFIWAAVAVVAFLVWKNFGAIKSKLGV